MNMAMPFLQSARVTVRPFTLADKPACDALFAALGNGAARLDWLEWVSRAPAELAALYQPPYGDRALVLRETGEMIGSVGLVPSFGPFRLLPGWSGDGSSASDATATGAHLNLPEVGLYWALHPAFRGQGYATEAGRLLIDFAFQTLRLRRIVATTEHANTASLAVMQRLRMRIEHNPFPDPIWFQSVGVLENPSVGGSQTQVENAEEEYLP